MVVVHSGVSPCSFYTHHPNPIWAPASDLVYISKSPPYHSPTVAERGRAFYFHNFQKWPFPIMIISDYEYFSLPKFLDTGFSYLIVVNHKNAQRCASRKELKEAGLFARIGFASLLLRR